MTVFSLRKRCFLHPALLCVALCFPAAALAAQAALPPRDLIQADEEDPLLKDALSEIETGAAEVVEKERDIAVKNAGSAQVGAGGLGTLPSAQAELPQELWQNIPEAEALRLVNLIPAGIESKAIRNLLLRVLVTDSDRTDFSEKMLLARVDALLKIGQAAQARQLLAVVPAEQASQTVLQKKHVLDVLSGQPQNTLCATAESQQIANPEGFWQRFQVLCQAVSAEKAKAQLGLELLREQNTATPTFEKLVVAVNESKPLPMKEIPESSEELAWLSFAGKLPEISAQASFEQLALLAMNPAHKGAWREKLKAQGANRENVSPPRTDTPDLPLSALHPTKDASPMMIRQALLAAAFRSVWDKPLPVEAEEKLIHRQYRAELLEISPVWRDAVSKMQEERKPLQALLTLISPFSGALVKHTVSDLTFLAQELRAMGLSVDAAALAEEAVGQK